MPRGSIRILTDDYYKRFLQMPDRLVILTERKRSGSPPNGSSTQEMSRFGELNGVFYAGLVELAKSPLLTWSLDRIQSIPFAAPSPVIRLDRRKERLLRRLNTGPSSTPWTP